MVMEMVMVAVMLMEMVMAIIALMVVDYRPSSRSAGGTPWHWRAGC